MFKVGDRVRCIAKKHAVRYYATLSWEESFNFDSNGDFLGQGVYVTGFSPYSNLILRNGNNVWNCEYNPACFIKISEATMSKYDELKARIEALNDGWNKEADDVLSEIRERYINPTEDRAGVFFVINTHAQHGVIKLVDKYTKELPSAYWEYNSQCEKHRQFRQAIIWLLDHSDIKKDEKAEKIAQLEKEMAEIKERIEELKR
jgi:hypothetical protein